MLLNWIKQGAIALSKISRKFTWVLVHRVCQVQLRASGSITLITTSCNIQICIFRGDGG